MGSSFNASQSSSVSSARTPGFSGNMMGTSGFSANSMASSGSAMGMSSSSMGNPMGSNMGNTMNSMTMTSSLNQGSNKPVDLSAFDNLMADKQKPKLSVNQMAQSKTTAGPMMGNTSAMGSYGTSQQGIMGQGMMGNSAMMGNQSMMGNQTMMGQQGMMGNPSVMQPGYAGAGMTSGFNSQFSNTGMGVNPNQNTMGMFQTQPMGGQNLMQPQQAVNTNTSSNSACSDLNDLFG